MKKLPICQSCKKDFQARLEKAYKLGMQDQQLKLQHTINILRRTNAELWKELTRLDRVSPLPNSNQTIRIPLTTMKRLIKLCCKHRMGTTVRFLRKIIDSQLCNLPNLTDKTKKNNANGSSST